MKRSHSFCELLFWIMCDIKIISFYYFPDCMIKHCISVMQDSMRWLNDQTFVRDVKFWMKIFDLDQMSKAILPRHISVEIRKGSKERRKGENGLRLSFLSFPCSLAFRHQSFTCPSRFALASVRKTKRLRRRQRLNGKAHSSKAMLDEHVWSFSLGLTTKSTSGWNLFRRCCHFTLLSYSWFMKIRNFSAASTQEPWEWDRSDSSFPSFDGWRHAWSTAHAARCKIFTIFGEESRYDHMDLEGF